MKYQDFSFSDKSEIERLLGDSEVEVRVSAIVGMINGISDWQWVQDKLLSLVNDENFWIAKNAITGLGDLARIYGKLDLIKVNKVLKKVMGRKDLKPVIESTIADFDIFLCDTKD